MQPEPLITRDYLAIERTRLANERTFLAYFRTFVGLLAGGLAIIKLPVLKDIQAIGILFVVTSPAILAVGILRLRYVRNKIRKFYRQQTQDDALQEPEKK